ncbi:hypothetical protein F2Q69_00015529 [Brassica cretica]|uniref:Uncharacterized protein n=1 Tax=Brassica cretica TaxID=69181 RepID=A0A8S9R9D1_BRACR|nr:hypothetical protein F2Q69_00015529 [Brassica cretica]
MGVTSPERHREVAVTPFQSDLARATPRCRSHFSYLSQTLENFSEDSWKILGRLLGKSSNVFYARRLPAKSSGSLPKSYAQGGINE